MTCKWITCALHRLTPLPKEEFKSHEVQKVAVAVLKRFLDNTKYSVAESSKLCKEISQQLIYEVKELGYIRHKIVCHVVLGEKQGQGFNVGSRCLSNKDADSFASASYANTSLFAVATVHGLYFE